MDQCNRRKFTLGAMAAIHAMTRGALAADAPRAAAPVPGAVEFKLDQEVRIGASSEPIRLAGGEFRVLSVGTAMFRLSKEGQLTAKLHAGVAEYAKADFHIYAAVYDPKGVLLGTASHLESVERVRLRVMPTMMRELELDFGKSRDFRRVAYASVAISNPDFPRPEN